MIATKKLDGYLSIFSKNLTKPQFENFRIAILWLFLDGKKSVTSISKKVINSKDQSTLNRFFSTSGWNEKEINKIRLKTLERNKDLKISSKGYFIIDDTLTEEFGEEMEWVGKYFDHTDGKYKNWRTILALAYAEWDNIYPIDVRIYYKIEEVWKLDFKTKNELAIEMIFEHLPKNKENYPICLFDSWFSWKDFLETLDKKGLMFITKPKSSRNVFIKGEKKKLPDLFEQADIAKWEIEWWRKELTFVKWEVRPNSQDNKENYYLMTNADLDRSDVIDNYDNRWPVEPMFKDMKQLFGWKDISFRSSLSTLRMLYLSFVAYVIALKEKLKNKKLKTIGEVCDFFRRSFLVKLIKKAYTLWKKSFGIDAMLVLFWL